VDVNHGSARVRCGKAVGNYFFHSELVSLAAVRGPKGR
jgi:hypothetical protein